jgi:hypothetical protein
MVIIRNHSSLSNYPVTKFQAYILLILEGYFPFYSYDVPLFESKTGKSTVADTV